MLGHGCRFKPAWWTDRIPQPWSNFLSELPVLEDGHHRITRADVLRSATSGQERCLQKALVAGFAWRSGPSGFQGGRRARIFRDNTDQYLADCLHSAAQLLSSAGPAEAYESMLRRGPNHLKHFSASFFTIFLYAVDADGARPGDALILDSCIATALCHVDGWDIQPTGPWDTRTYERWLEHAHNLAAASRSITGNPVRADAVEMAYYNHGRSAQRSLTVPHHRGFEQHALNQLSNHTAAQGPNESRVSLLDSSEVIQAMKMGS